MSFRNPAVILNAVKDPPAGEVESISFYSGDSSASPQNDNVEKWNDKEKKRNDNAGKRNNNVEKQNDNAGKQNDNAGKQNDKKNQSITKSLET